LIQLIVLLFSLFKDYLVLTLVTRSRSDLVPEIATAKERLPFDRSVSLLAPHHPSDQIHAAVRHLLINF
jgi:hypothetical protein